MSCRTARHWLDLPPGARERTGVQDICNTVAVITGAASGIGPRRLAPANRFAAEGACARRFAAEGAA